MQAFGQRDEKPKVRCDEQDGASTMSTRLRPCVELNFTALAVLKANL